MTADWTFDSPAVAANFPAHVREQLPWYDLATDAVAQIGRHYIGRGGLVYDIGAATGNIGNALATTIEARDARLVAIEASADMAAAYAGPGRVEVGDAITYRWEPCDFAVCFLTLMFVRPDHVGGLLDGVTDALVPGGALVVVERTTPPQGYASLVLSRMTLAAKRAAGVPADRIIDKELSLSGVQRPVDPQLLASRGAVEWFRFGDFAGYLIEKDAA
jgi:tRNA (cmo5U34)-methyltransferase